MIERYRTLIALSSVLVCFIACSQVCAHSLDTMMYRADRLTKKGQYQEALNAYVSVYRNSHKKSEWCCVRNSFLLNPFVELAKKYPPALSAIHDLRDEAEVRIIDGHPTPDDLLDWSSINEKLGEYSHALAVYKQLKSQDSLLCKDLVCYLFETLVRDADYDAVHIVAIADAEYESGRLRELRGYRGSVAGLHRILSRRYVLYQALLGAHEFETANSLANQLWAVSPNSETRNSLIHAAKLAGNEQVMTDLKNLGCGSGASR